jgi:hypothetical protein
MSSKNILTLDKNTYIEKNEKRILKMSDAYFFDKHFLLGGGVDRDEMIFSTIFASFLCESNCEINDLIDKKIKGELEILPEDNPINTIKKSENGGGDTYIINNYIGSQKWDKEVEW